MISAIFSERSSMGSTLCPAVTEFHWKLTVLSLLDWSSPVPAGGGTVGQVFKQGCCHHLESFPSGQKRNLPVPTPHPEINILLH